MGCGTSYTRLPREEDSTTPLVVVDAPSCNEQPSSQQQGRALGEERGERSSSHEESPVSEEGGDARVEVVHAVERWVCVKEVNIWVAGMHNQFNRSGHVLMFGEELEVSEKKEDVNGESFMQLTDGRGWVKQASCFPFGIQITRNGDAEAGFKYCHLSGCISEVGTGGAAALAGMDAGHVGCCITHVDGRQLVSKFMVSSVLCRSKEEGLHYYSEKDLKAKLTDKELVPWGTVVEGIIIRGWLQVIFPECSGQVTAAVAKALAATEVPGRTFEVHALDTWGLPKAPSLAVGDHVQARRINGGSWQDATLVKERSGNNFLVDWDNGDRSDRIKHVHDGCSGPLPERM